ncbi:MAG: phosphate ABC transporter ATP-binding protein PstB [Candidatus Altiarchaeales archaeon]|nr:phosphate ABC transporter ATP-binding protein [Candidatus Altiarchaeota archaeon]MBU4342294.1 phosphate ABC transporter ATP-binding protein [Candidatus Altiarchaeota archaeon]MBU4432769.1 phosphate ABC transporter ATP-binding protein [Patescibacteria group bacterium]MBU4437471.1 phosphate ABC transporter ATP-binding protein [Candidatus Altiarchaeota archaeon]MCG2782043.1 phosphate ABC transporter ATP-binding protein PstB [Candidatus Altiarchaeales archaeon]
MVKLEKNNVKVEFRGVNFCYNEEQILFNVDFKVPSNRITALIGPSGCGKSTLIRCINRMNEVIPMSRMDGQVLYNKENIYDKHVDVVELRRRIGMVFQKPNPFPMSIFDNVAYGLRLQNVKDKSMIRETVKESLVKADLWVEVKDRLDLSAFRLSGGQQQRLCIARALAVNPDVILLDEPCSALDPIATARIESLLKKLKKEETIVIVTHNMHQARRISDYTCYLFGGKIIEYSETEEIFNNPQNKLTKDYISGEFG